MRLQVLLSAQSSRLLLMRTCLARGYSEPPQNKHRACLHADLVDEDHAAAVLGGQGREYPQARAHQPRLRAHLHAYCSELAVW